ncbi:WD40 repeat domain-containing protein [Actinoplanes sp. NPDC000266]
MSRTSRVVFALAVVLGSAVVFGVGLDRADKLASVLSFFIGLAALLVTVGQVRRPARGEEHPAPSRPRETISEPRTAPSRPRDRRTAAEPVVVRARPSRRREWVGEAIAVVIVVIVGTLAVWIRNTVRDDEPKSVVWRGDLRAVAELGATGVVRGIAFNPDGKSMATAADHVEVWDLESRASLRRIDIESDIYDVSYSPDGRMLAATGFSGEQSIRIWTVSDWRVMSDNLSEGTGYFTVAWRDDNRTLATAGVGGVRIWSAGDAAFAGRDIVTTAARQARFGPDGLLAMAVAGSEGEAVEVVRYPQPDHLMRFPAGDGDARVLSLAVSRDGSSLAAGLSDGRLLVWNLRRLSDPPATLQRSGAMKVELSFSPDGQLVAASESSGAVKVWNVAERAVVASAWVGGGDVEFSPDGRVLAVADAHRILLLAPA